MYIKILKFKYILIFISILTVFATMNTTASASLLDMFKLDPSGLYNVQLSGNCYAYKYGSKWGLFNKSNNEIITHPIYGAIKPLNSNMFAVLENGYWGIISSNGNIISESIWEDIFFITKNGFGIKKNGLYGWISNSGAIVQPPVYTSINAVDKNAICVCDGNLCGLASAITGKLLKPVKYEGKFVGIWDYSYLFYLKNGKYYIMDLFGVLITKTGYSAIEDLNENVIYTKEGKHIGLVRMRDGKEIAKPVYNNIKDMARPGFYKVKQNGKWGAVDFDGNLIFNCEYGPLEINRLVKNYPDNQKYKDICDYNYYYQQYLKAYYELEYARIKNIFLKRMLKKILSDENKYTELKTKTNELIKKYNINM